MGAMKLLHLCQPGFEDLLCRELQALPFRLGNVTALQVESSGPGFALASSEDPVPAEVFDTFCFPHLTLLDPREVREESVNRLAGQLAEMFLEDLGDVRLDGSWYCDLLPRRDQEGLARRATRVREVFLEKLKKRMARLVRLAAKEPPGGPGAVRGWGGFFEDYQRVFASSRLIFGGQRRMADDPAAPSRSFLKVEEAYRVLGCGPREGERVADLGAAPGGWSYSAARRGARVDAVDNGPLKAGAKDREEIRHLREDGFRFGPGAGEPYDWLFCDMVEDPYRILRLLDQWVQNEWCRKFVINLKFGRADPVALLREVGQVRKTSLGSWPVFRVRHLFHDREEITLVGASSAVPQESQP